MYLDESFFDTFPKEVKYNQYVVIDAYGTLLNVIWGLMILKLKHIKSIKKHHQNPEDY